MREKLRLPWIFLCLLACLSSAATLADEGEPPAARPPAARPTAAQVDEIFAEWNGTRTPGCSLGVYRDDEIVYARGYGMANLEYGLANGPRSVFRIGSTSKQFAAMAVAVLAEAGELSLDDDVHKFFPEMPDYGAPLTVHHLVHHTSGLRDYLTLAELADWSDDYSVAEAVALIARQKELNFAPGEEFLYSNSNYFLMSQIVEKVSGKTLHEWAEEHMFRPLGMKDTHFHDDHTHIVRNRADGHARNDDGGFRLSMTTLEMVGDGGIYTTVEDLLLWDRNFYDNRLGKGGPELIETVETSAELNDGEDTNYAFGLFLGEHRGLRKIGHGGAFVGYRAAFDRYPDQHFSIAVLCNLGTVRPGSLARQVAELYLQSEMDEMVEDGGEEAGAADPEVAELSLGELRQVTGDYWNESQSLAREIVLTDGKLFYARGGGRDTELTALGENRFRMVDAPVEILFEGDEAKPDGAKPQRMTLTFGGRPPLVFEAIERSAPTTEDLAAYAGRFYSDELMSEQVLAVQGGVLTVESRAGGMELAPIFADVFTAGGVVVRFERDAGGDVVALTINAGRVRNLRCVRR